MDLLGDIVEHPTEKPTLNESVRPAVIASAKKPSRWKQRLQQKGINSMSGVVQNEKSTPEKPTSLFTKDEDTNMRKFNDPKDRKLDYTGLSESEQIHQENIEILSRMSTDEREEAKQELLDSLDPQVLQMLMRRSAKKYGNPNDKSGKGDDTKYDIKDDPLYQPVEGSMGTWVGGEHELDREEQIKEVPIEKMRETVQIRKHAPPTIKTSSTTSTTAPLKSALKTSESIDESLNETVDDSKPKKIRFSKESKVIYLDQSEKVKQDTPSPSNSDGEWEDVEDINDRTPSPEISLPKIDDDAAPSIEDAKKLCNDPTHDHDHDHEHTHSTIHFPKPTQPYEELDINDPKFNDKLYEKYYPDLPKNPQQLEWMKPTTIDDIPKEIEYDSIESVRFDFKGNIITSDNIGDYLNENQGLFNHSQNPELPGYTLPELAHYLRSTFPGQVCIACRTLGRIMFKLGSLEYQINEQIDDESNIKKEGTEGNFEIECWKLIDQLKIIQLLEVYSSDNQKNLSIKNYAIDALWLWKKCKGDEKIKKYRENNESKE